MFQEAFSTMIRADAHVRPAAKCTVVLLASSVTLERRPGDDGGESQLRPKATMQNKRLFYYIYLQVMKTDGFIKVLMSSSQNDPTVTWQSWALNHFPSDY